MKKLFIVFGTGATIEYFYTKHSDAFRRHINVEFVSVDQLDPLAALNAINMAIVKKGSTNVSQNIVFYVGKNLQLLPKNVKCPSIDMEGFRKYLNSLVDSPDGQKADIVDLLFAGAMGKCLEQSDD